MTRILTLICAAFLAGSAVADVKSSTQPVGKPAAKVDVTYAIIGTPRAGQPLDIELTVVPKSSFDEIRLDFGGSERLALDRSTPDTMGLMAQKQGVPAVQRVRVVPQGDGLHYFKVRVVTFDANGRSRMRGIAIPIGVGKYDARAHLKSNGTLVDGVGGERAIVMRAQ